MDHLRSNHLQTRICYEIFDDGAFRFKMFASQPSIYARAKKESICTMPDRHFILTRVGGVYDLDKPASATDPIVVVIIGMLLKELDQEINPRRGDVEEFLKRTVAGRGLRTKMVQLILYDLRAEKQVQTIQMSFGPVQVVSVKATEYAKPVLSEIMKGAHEVAKGTEVAVGNQVDVVVSDWSSPSLDVSGIMSISTLKFMKMGGVAYLSTVSPDARVTSGGRYYQNLDNPLRSFPRASWKDHFTMKGNGEGNPLLRNGAASAATIQAERKVFQPWVEFGLTKKEYDEQMKWAGGYAAPFVDLGAQ